MKLNIDRDLLLKQLTMVSGVVERKQTLPILSHILINLANRNLSITATDLEVEMITVIPIDYDGEINITLAAKKFIDICKALPEGSNLTLSIKEQKVTITSGKSRFVLTTLPAEDFPSIDTLVETFSFNITQGNLKKLIERTHFAMAQQDVRYYLNGLLFELSEQGLQTVATDGHRLAISKIETDIKTDEIQQVIIPRKGVVELMRLLNNSDEIVSVQLSNNHIRFISESMTFTSKLIEGRFPDYERVMPHVVDKELIADRSGLKQALARASILSNEKIRGIRLQLSSGTIKLSAHNPEQEEAEEEFSVNYEGDDLEIGFNVNYLLDALTAVTTNEVKFSLSDPNSCCMIEGTKEGEGRYIVMPMRL